MLRIAFVGPTRAGKSSEINALAGHHLADIGYGNITKTIAEYGPIILSELKCTLIDTPANCPLMDNVDVVLYLVDVNNGGIDDVEWAKFRDYYVALNKSRTVPIQFAILITKCDTLPSSVSSVAPPNILIAESTTDEGLVDDAMLKIIDSISKKYADTCPVIPFNAHGRAAFHLNSSPALVKTVGRRADTNGFVEFDVERFYDIKTTSAEFFALRLIMNRTDTLIADIKKYITCWSCKKEWKMESQYSGNYCYCHQQLFTYSGSCGTCFNEVRLKIKPTPDIKPDEHLCIQNGQNNQCAKCWTSSTSFTSWWSWSSHSQKIEKYSNGTNTKPDIKCTRWENSKVSDYPCGNGLFSCTFNTAHPCGQIANKLMELYKTAPSKVKDAIIQFAFNGRSQFGKSPNYNAKLWNLMATHLTFDCASHFDIKMARTKDETFRLLQFGRNLPIPDKIDIYCAALRLPAESADSLTIECANGESGIFADRPIYNISDLKLAFDLIPTKRRGATFDQLFVDLGENMHYSPDILAQMAAIIDRINTDDYGKNGLFK
jgi:hypothetical protein